MPRVLAQFTVSGPPSGFPPGADQITISFAVLDDGSCVAAVAKPPQCFVENCNASIYPMETTAEMIVYTCRFTLVYCEGDTAMRGNVVGCLSYGHGFQGRCMLYGDPGSVVVSYPVDLPPQDAQPHTDDELAPVVAAAAAKTLVNQEAPRPVEMFFRGNQVDSTGKTYVTTLYLAKVADSTQIEGFAREASRKSRIVGNWDGDIVRFRLEYPLRKGVVYNYDYDGTVVENAGSTRLVGTWRFAGGVGTQQAFDAVLHGKFDFVRDTTLAQRRRVSP